MVNGKKVGTDINLYKLFIERCFKLLRAGGRCGMLSPGSFYTDLGSKQLREMLFSEGQIDVLFGLSNERFIFEGVDHRQKICLLAFEKGGATKSFTAAFRINPREAISPDALDAFLHSRSEHVQVQVALVRRLSPDSLSVMEFRSDIDVRIAEKMLRFPLLGEQIDATWNLRLTREFDMTNDSDRFKTSPARGRLPLYEGKRVHQFTHAFSSARYWLNEKEARKSLLEPGRATDLKLDYQDTASAFATWQETRTSAL